MNVWLLKDGENLPIQPGARRMRTWMLAERLLERGHSVVWWTSTFSHQRRTHLHRTDLDVEVSDRFQLRLLSGGGYERNVSWARYRHHVAVAKRFRQAAATAAPPDAIVSAFPTIELAYEAARYSAQRGVPSIIDVRDLWPDVIVAKSPPAVRHVVRLAVTAMARKRRWAFRRATSLVATSARYLEWAAAHRGVSASAHDRVFFLGAEATPEVRASEKIDALAQRLSGKTVFAYIGSFGKSYDLALVIDAAARLAAGGNRRVHFVLAGDGEQLPVLRKRAGSLPNVAMTGWLDQGELTAVLQHADVGLVPCISAPGTVPNKVFDYLAVGIPVISSLEGEMAGIIEGEGIGFSYRCGDVDAFARAVLALDSDPELRRRQARNASSLYATRYRAEAIYNAYADHVEAIARQTALGADVTPAQPTRRTVVARSTRPSTGCRLFSP